MDVGYGIAVDSSGNAYITGETGSGDFPTVNAFQHSYAGTNDAFVAKIGLDTPQVSLASSVNPSKAGQKVTFTVTVSGSSGTPTGQITYLVDGSSVGSYSLNSNGQAAYAISSLSAGQHTIQASYSGDFNYNQGNQASLVQKVIAPEQLPPADLVGQLRLTPDRVAANNAENLISFAFTVKNVGQGRATSVTVQLPIDPQLVIGYTEFNNPSVWVSAVNTDSVIVSLPPLANNDIINGTLIFRPNPDTVPVPGSIFSTRYTLTWTNPAGDTRQKLSNGAAFTFGVAGSNLDVSGGLVQLMSADAPNGTKITYRSNFWIGDEIVTAWLTRPDNTSVELAQGLASPQGEFAVEVDSNGLAPGTYVVAAYGQRSQVYGSGLLVVNDSGSSQAGSATMTWLKGLGQSEIIKDLTNPNK